MNKHWLELIILLFSLIFAGLVTSILLSFFQPTDTSQITSVNSYIQSAVFTQVFMFGGAAVLYFKLTGIALKPYISIKLPLKHEWVYTLVFFSIAILITIALSPLKSAIESNYATHPWVAHQIKINTLQSEIIGQLRGAKLVIAILFFAILPAIFEEVIFRGILYKVLKDISKKKVLSMILSAIIFSFFHFQVLSFIPIMIVGILLAALYEKTNNLVNAIALHFAFNAIQVILGA